MKKPQLYLETSVWNFHFANDAPEKREITLRFFDKVKQDEYEIFISDVVIEEIGRADDNKKRSLLSIIAESSPTRLISDEEVAELAELAQKYT
jgi:predicted nucleic acid-binding protein